MTTIQARLEELPGGTVIPKPEAKGDFIIKGWGMRRGERALIYTIPNHKNSSKPHQKGITRSEWERAFERLQGTGEFTHLWFNTALPACAKEGSCNFTTIGGVFQLLGLAAYKRRGIYSKAH